MNLKKTLTLVTILFSSIQLFAQDLTVTGTVTDQNNAPIAGANVLVVNTTRGTQTDFDGNYSINVSSGEELRFSYVGFAAQTVTITTQTTVNITLLEDTSQLEEVVVIGYGSQKKSDLTGSVASVKSEELNAFPVLNAQQALQGRAAGVEVQTNNGGEPGAPIAIRIRGNGSILASSTPLIVVDGFVGAPFPQANDIASIEVLKDASSTAIYGSQGSNGVVLITTKKGAKGKLNVEINSTYAVQNTANSLDLLNASEFADYQNQVRQNVAITNGSTAVPYVQGDADTDWQDLLYRSGFTTNHQLSFSGGSENINFYASANYFDQGGIVVNSDFERLTFVSNVDANISEKFKIGVNLFGSISTQNSVASQSDGSVTVGSDDAISLAARFAPDRGIFNPDGSFTINDAIGDPVDNPFAVATERVDETEEDNFRANLFAEYEIVKGLTFKTTFGLSSQNVTNGQFQPSTLIITAAADNGRASISNVRRESVLTESYLTYNTEIGKGNLTLLGGYSYQKRTNEGFSAAGTDFISDDFSFRALGSALGLLQPTSFLSEVEIESQFGRVNFDWDDKYLITGTVRRDGSSNFAANNKFAVFPSVALGWRISNEDFLKESKSISNLKLRASYGVVGNPSISPFQSLATFRTLFASSGGETVSAITPDRPANPDLRWESSFQTNVGLDLGLFSNKVSLTLDYYNTNTRDLIFINNALLDALGFANPTPFTNAGEINNSGFEVGINTVNISKGDFTWSTDFNISFNRSEAVSLLEGLDIFLNAAPSYFSTSDNVIVREGEQVGLFWGLDYRGVYQGGDFPAGTAAFPNAVAGDPLFADVDGDGAIANADRTIIGNPNPDFTFGLNNTLSYKNFDLNIFFQGSQGNDIFNLTDVQLNNGDSNTTRSYFNNAWTPSNTNTNQPRVGNNSAREISSRFVENGSYIRLKNLAIGYTLPSTVTKKLGVQSLRLAISGQNLLTFTNYSGLDPEANFFGSNGTNNQSSNVIRGFDFGNYPTLQAVNFSVNLKF
ncbi:SusC/RagA family TonB-linked outer membrane protein [Spongiimicrobium salis]|uniref:SusC/RagA family TonB-linked outer membrane protein n=1 Tax=Spongiimicrobium salis TaxID=1667022 RepID=UPI00374DDEBE